MMMKKSLFVAIALVAATAFGIEVHVPLTDNTNTLLNPIATELYRAGELTVFRLTPGKPRQENPAEDVAGTRPSDTVISAPSAESESGQKLTAIEPEPVETFHGHAVYGTATISHPQQIVQLVRSLEKGMTGEIAVAKCFIPEYGISFKSCGGRLSNEFLLSLQCHGIRLQEGDTESFAAILDRPGADIAKQLDAMLSSQTETVITK
jgi:hypothetical protein